MLLSSCATDLSQYNLLSWAVNDNERNILKQEHILLTQAPRANVTFVSNAIYLLEKKKYGDQAERLQAAMEEAGLVIGPIVKDNLPPRRSKAAQAAKEAAAANGERKPSKSKKRVQSSSGSSSSSPTTSSVNGSPVTARPKYSTATARRTIRMPKRYDEAADPDEISDELKDATSSSASTTSTSSSSSKDAAKPKRKYNMANRKAKAGGALDADEVNRDIASTSSSSSSSSSMPPLHKKRHRSYSESESSSEYDSDSDSSVSSSTSSSSSSHRRSRKHARKHSGRYSGSDSEEYTSSSSAAHSRSHSEDEADGYNSAQSDVDKKPRANSKEDLAEETISLSSSPRLMEESLDSGLKYSGSRSFFSAATSRPRISSLALGLAAASSSTTPKLSYMTPRGSTIGMTASPPPSALGTLASAYSTTSASSSSSSSPAQVAIGNAEDALLSLSVARRPLGGSPTNAITTIAASMETDGQAADMSGPVKTERTVSDPICSASGTPFYSSSYLPPTTPYGSQSLRVFNLASNLRRTPVSVFTGATTPSSINHTSAVNNTIFKPSTPSPLNASPLSSPMSAPSVSPTPLAPAHSNEAAAMPISVA